MMARSRVFLLLLGLLFPVYLVPVANGQTTITVMVGDTGSFYDPPTISALNGDTVNFIFVGSAHTVTQSSFETPCLPLDGGFSSGIAGTGGNASAIPPSWSLKITNTTEPIWFFCQATKPESHCASGMVGAINVPSESMFDAFTSAAKAVSGTPTPTPVVILSGIGAFATNSPAVTGTPAITTSAPQSTSSPTLLPNTTVTVTGTGTILNPVIPTSPSSNSSNVGAIAGGVAGGVAALFIIGILIALLTRAQRKSKRSPTSPASEVKVTSERTVEQDGHGNSPYKEPLARFNVLSLSGSGDEARESSMHQSEPTWITSQAEDRARWGLYRKTDTSASNDAAGSSSVYPRSRGSTDQIRTDFLELSTPLSELPGSLNSASDFLGPDARARPYHYQDSSNLNPNTQEGIPHLHGDSKGLVISNADDKEQQRHEHARNNHINQPTIDVREIASQVAAILHPTGTAVRQSDQGNRVAMHAPKPHRKLPVPSLPTSPGPPQYES